MSKEYQAVHKAGLILQIDAPDLAMDRTMMYRDLSDSDFVKRCERHVAAINKGIEGIPRERVRLHVCYGNWEGPHIHDIPLEKILPALYTANVGALSIEFSNPRHAHEYAALKKHPLPPHMLLIPGVVETTSNFVEHPEVVARRIEEAVAAVGDRERVIASTDCGFGTFTKREWVIEPAPSTLYHYRVIAVTPGGDVPSNTATATTFPTTAAKICATQVSPYHAWARGISVARAGAQWFAAWSDRKGGANEEIYVQALTANGAPSGSPTRITTNDMLSRNPTLVWNGTHLGLLWVEQMRDAVGGAKNDYRFALLSNAGALLRGPLPLFTNSGSTRLHRRDPRLPATGLGRFGLGRVQPRRSEPAGRALLPPGR